MTYSHRNLYCEIAVEGSVKVPTKVSELLLNVADVTKVDVDVVVVGSTADSAVLADKYRVEISTVVST
jgi:hypothetical protein